jgi:hypothetical protein
MSKVLHAVDAEDEPNQISAHHQEDVPITKQSVPVEVT